jgi:hypothetical protein
MKVALSPFLPHRLMTTKGLALNREIYREFAIRSSAVTVLQS